jgi:hypothetical protein
MTTRRSFFEDVALLSALAAALEQQGYSQPADAAMSNFWDSYFSEATRDPNQISRGASDGDLVDPARKVQLVQGTKEGLRLPDAIPDSELRSDTNDVVVTMNPGHFRPAPDDSRAVARSRGCQVRMDWFQTRPIMNLLAPMAWAGLAAWSVDKTAYAESYRKDINGAKVLDPKTGKPIVDTSVKAGPAPPALKDLEFRDPNDPNAPLQNQIILMGGSGRMALNVRAVRVNEKLRTVLDRSVRYSSIVAPFFGFAPIAIPALRAFTDLLGAVFNHEAIIMNSMPLQILATQSARRGPHSMSSVKIVGGDYIAVPANQAANLSSDMEKLRVVDGWLVHQDSNPNLPVAQRAQDRKIPEVSYVSMSLTVEPLSDVIKRKAQGG